MCGFAALFEPGRTFGPDLLAGIDRDLHHRGPDSGGLCSEAGNALVFRRLAIIDTGHASDQPMNSADGQQTLVFNGEIYNFRELRQQLDQQGVTLRTQGDSEVILEGYRTWGPAVVDRLEGMYAFVIVDRARQKAFAARDPFGIKPLYVMRRGRLTALASEMRPFARLEKPVPDPEALAELLTFGWAAGGLSNLKDIERLPGGTSLEICLKTGAVQRRRFLDPLDTLTSDDSLTYEQAREQADAAVRRSVEAHLMSDVGYAIELSGGIDSSLVAALASRRSDRPIASFSIDLGAYEHDEKPYREMVCARYPLIHHEISMTGRDFADSLPRAVRHLEGPSRHAGCVMIMRLCDEIRKHTKVVLTGEGADELFGGYLRYATWPKDARAERISRLLPKRLWPQRWPFLGIRRLAGSDAAVMSALYRDPGPVQELFAGLVPKPGARDAASRRFDTLVERLFAVDQTDYLESLLIRQDKVSMAASVEARVPFTHVPLARVVNRIPAKLRAPGGITKPILKDIAEQYLPKELVRRRKIGLWLPMAEWLGDGEGLGRYLDDVGSPNGKIRVFGDGAKIDRAIAAFRAGNGSLAPALIRLVNLELWLRSLDSAESVVEHPAAAPMPTLGPLPR